MTRVFMVDGRCRLRFTPIAGTAQLRLHRRGNLDLQSGGHVVLGMSANLKITGPTHFRVKRRRSADAIQKQTASRPYRGRRFWKGCSAGCPLGIAVKTGEKGARRFYAEKQGK
eukprot:g20812.t1